MPCKAWALMTESAVYLQPAYILQKRQYLESSLIIDIFTRDFGRVSLLAKGVRKAKSKTAGLLQPFMPLSLSYFGRTDLKLLTGVEATQPFVSINGLALYCGFYMNELVTCFLQKYDPHPEVFRAYHDALLRLSNSIELEATLRIFELQLIGHIGYGLQLDYDQNEAPIEASKRYFFDPEKGPIESERGLFSGAALLAMQTQDFTEVRQLAEAKILMRAVIDFHLRGKLLKSRAVINQIIKPL